MTTGLKRYIGPSGKDINRRSLSEKRYRYVISDLVGKTFSPRMNPIVSFRLRKTACVASLEKKHRAGIENPDEPALSQLCPPPVID